MTAGGLEPPKGTCFGMVSFSSPDGAERRHHVADHDET